VSSADLTGDETPEYVVALMDPTAQPLGPLPPGQLFIFTCAAGVYSQAFDSGYTGDLSVPLIHYLEDVTGEGPADLLYTVSLCGAHTCFDTLSVIHWDGGAMVNAVNGDTTLAYATVSLAPKPGGEFVRDIVMYGGTIGSVGAGPQRPLTNIWSWDGFAYTLSSTFPDPALYRFHVLNDADDAALEGDQATALLFYQRVIDDDTLLAWEPVVDEQSHLTGYARYRLMILRLLAGEASEAENRRNELLVEFTAGAPGGEWSPAADAFFERFEQDEDAHAACSDVIDYLNANPDALLTLNSYGYENRTYDASSVCPY
jgi:hypothetical protein